MKWKQVKVEWGLSGKEGERDRGDPIKGVRDRTWGENQKCHGLEMTIGNDTWEFVD
jgi:hypothetical protein